MAELTDLLDLTSWAPGMRVIARKETPHPVLNYGSPTLMANGSPRSRPTRPGGSWPTWSCATGAAPAARTGSPIAKDTGLANLPLQSYDSNRIWCAIVMLAGDLLAWVQTLALHDHPARRWEPKRLRHRLLTYPLPRLSFPRWSQRIGTFATEGLMLLRTKRRCAKG